MASMLGAKTFEDEQSTVTEVWIITLAVTFTAVTFTKIAE